MDIVYPHFVDEVYEVRFNPSHRWFYKRGMGADDVAIFKLHDTHMKHTGTIPGISRLQIIMNAILTSLVSTVCPHSAFVDPTVPDKTPPRASIEVKIMVFGGNTV